MERGVATLDIKIAGTVTPRGETVPGKRMSMRKTREVLRLYFELKLRQRQIARSANVSQSTVHEYVERFRAAGLSWPLPAEMSESELEEKLFPADSGVSRPVVKTPPDFAYIHQQLQEHKHTTLQLLWEEYRAGHTDGYGYSRFCHHYQRFKQERDLVLRQCHRPARSCLSIGRERPCRSTIQQPASHAPRSCSWRCWEPATTPMPRLRWISRWAVGSEPTCGRWSFSAAARS